MKITIEAQVSAPVEKVWQAWTTPANICQWNFATDTWHCPSAEIDLVVGGKFTNRMEAKDGSMGFDFRGEFVIVEPLKRIVFKLEDEREVTVKFI